MTHTTLVAQKPRVTMRRLLVFVAVAGTALLAGAAPAQAQVPGPNGQILFVHADPALSGQPVTYRVNPDGSGLQQLFPGSTDNARWSPDGSEVAMECDSCGGSAVIVNVDTGTSRSIPAPDPGALDAGCFWAWSADGSRLACEGFGLTDPTLNGIYTVRSSDGGGLTRITSNPGGTDHPSDFSPDGKSLLLARSDQNDQVVGLFVVKLKGGVPRQITPSGMILQDSGSWSPNGKQILLAARPATDHRFAIWVMNADGSGLHQLPITPSCGGAFSDRMSIGCYDPVWSPDGTKIVFARVTAAGTQRNISTVNADGSGLFQVTHSGTNDNADWGTHPLAR